MMNCDDLHLNYNKSLEELELLKTREAKLNTNVNGLQSQISR